MKKRAVLVLAALLLCAVLTACGGRGAGGTVTVASKQFTENMLLGEMYARLIEHHTDLTVERKQSLGPTAVCYAALEKGEVDIYVEYTGTIYVELLKYGHDPDMTSDRLYDLIKDEMSGKKGVTVCRPIGLNNTYALAMQQNKAEILGIRTVSDLKDSAPRLVFAANDLFYVRANDGYNAMTEKYDLRFRSAVKMGNDVLYDAVSADQVDVVVVYATDALLPKYDMVILEDDKRLFPDYYALPVIRSGTLERYPGLADVLELLYNRIDNTQMQELNYSVDVEGNSLSDVAEGFLTELGLLGE